MNNNKPVIALSDKQASIVHVDSAWTVLQPLAAVKGQQVLIALYEQLLVQSMLSDLSSNDTIVVLDVAESMRAALTRRCGEKGVVLVVLSTSVSSRAKNVTCVYKHESRRSIRAKLPSAIFRFVTMSTAEITAKEIAACLPPRCDVMTLESLTDDHSHITNTSFGGLDSEVTRLLKIGCSHVKAERYNIELHKVRSATPTQLSSLEVVDKKLSLVDWTSDVEVPVRVQPAPTLVKFSADKTYWLVGLTGGLGLSICRWMIDRGAKYLVMTSRNPKIDTSWWRKSRPWAQLC
ncbi:MAG: hypothetical protein Q9166_006337 [cf. Caloplaca sp. 2 TL-2023]